MPMLAGMIIGTQKSDFGVGIDVQVFIWTGEIVGQTPGAISPWRQGPELTGVIALVGQVYGRTINSGIIDHVQDFIWAKPTGWEIVFSGAALAQLPELPCVVAAVDHVEFVLASAIVDHVERLVLAGIIVPQSVIGWKIRDGVRGCRNRGHYCWRKSEAEECWDSLDEIAETHDGCSQEEKKRVKSAIVLLIL